MPRAPRLLLLFCLPWLGGCERAFFATLNLRTAVQAEHVSYGAAPHQAIDVFVPPAAAAGASVPVVVFFYGGRWQEGRRADYAFVGEALAARGVLTFVADYRHYPAVRFPGFMHDAAQAVAWVHAHAVEYGGDPGRLHLAGHSAGAHLAALLGTDARYLSTAGLQPRQLRGVIGIAGPYDFLPLTDADLKQVFGPEPGWRESQPIEFVDGDEPPFLLLHGADDRSVGPHNSANLAAKLRAAGIRVEHRVYPDAGHVRILAAIRYPALAPTLEDVVAFVQRPAD
jgi:acetyl esterase/lipase